MCRLRPIFEDNSVSVPFRALKIFEDFPSNRKKHVLIVSSSRFCWNPPKSLNRWRPSASCGPDRPFGHSWWICFTQWMLYTTPCWFCPTGLGAWALWIETCTMCPCMCLWCFFGSSLTPAFFCDVLCYRAIHPTHFRRFTKVRTVPSLCLTGWSQGWSSSFRDGGQFVCLGHSRS